MRPQRLSEFIGQEQSKDLLEIVIQAAIIKDQPPPHLLLSGPAGTGKTTIAEIMGVESESRFIQYNAASLDNTDVLIEELIGKPRAVVFIDEIHRLKKEMQESLYRAMEDFKISTLYAGQNIEIDVPRFCLIGATTNPDKLTKPMRDRFLIKANMISYSSVEMETIIRWHHQSVNPGQPLTDRAVTKMEGVSRSNPRLAVNFLALCEDVALVKKSELDEGLVELVMKKTGMDANGINPVDHRVMSVILNNFNGGPVGGELLAMISEVSRGELTEMVEPYLIKLGLVERTPKGRVLTERGVEYVGAARIGL